MSKCPKCGAPLDEEDEGMWGKFLYCTNDYCRYVRKVK